MQESQNWPNMTSIMVIPRMSDPSRPESPRRYKRSHTCDWPIAYLYVSAVHAITLLESAKWLNVLDDHSCYRKTKKNSLPIRIRCFGHGCCRECIGSVAERLRSTA